MHFGLPRRRGSDAIDAPLSDVEFVALARDAFELLEDEAKPSGAGTGPVVAGTGPVVAGTQARLWAAVYALLRPVPMSMTHELRAKLSSLGFASS